MKSHQYIQILEARLEELQALILTKINELQAFQETSVSLRHELDSLKAMLEKEEKQMENTSLQKAPKISLSSSFQPVNFAPSSVQNSLQNKTSEHLESILPDSTATSFKPSRFSKSADALWNKELKSSTSGRYPEFSQRPVSAFYDHEKNRLRPGQTHVYMNTLFKESKKDTREKRFKRREFSPKRDSYNTAISSAVGNMKIAEVHANGHCIKLLNSSEKEEDIGDYILQQNVGGHPVIKYRFPPKIRVKAKSIVTVWAAKANMSHNPPSDFVWKDQKKIGAGTEYTTILCKPNGHAVAWYTPMHWNRANEWDQYAITNEFQNLMELSKQTEEQKDETTEIYESEASGTLASESEPYFQAAEEDSDWCTPMLWNKSQVWDQDDTINKVKSGLQLGMQMKEEDKYTEEPELDLSRTLKTKPKSSRSGAEESSMLQMEEKIPVLLQREKTSPIVLPPTSSPWAQSMASPIHPDYSLYRALPMGHDGSSLCRQSRTQNTASDPAPGNLYAGGQKSKGMCLGRKGSRGPTRSAVTSSWKQQREIRRRKELQLHRWKQGVIESGTREERNRETNSRGVMYLGSPLPTGSSLQKYFADSSYNIRLPSQASFTISNFSNL
ncbi:lamin tail domain-containing protein 1 [Rhinatrema bivittatum]|uniref:lamin tail domain-containing protein 1 n=1 Tax=Rhinatrema bivittatum TaxID=194408 RepID=UPI00112B0D29|nr:lamin tail domain-containing protein 1 [Rhinatrema bivittatum]